MGVRNVLVEGHSGVGKTSVCEALTTRGFQAVHGDRELAYQGDPVTGEPTETASHFHHLWDVDRVRALAADTTAPVTFFCGGSRNHAAFLDVFDAVVVLETDLDTLRRRLDARPDEFGHTPTSRALVERLHASGEGLPPGAPVDATRPLDEVVDAVLRVAGVEPPHAAGQG